MKKLFAVLLALCLLGSVAMAETAVKELKWADVEAKAAELGGGFAEFESIGYKMYIPAGFETVEVPEDAKNAGVAVILSNGTLTFSIALNSIEGMSGEDYLAALQQAGATEIELGLINGVEAISYELTPENGIKTGNVAISTSDNTVVITFTFAPIDNAEMQAELPIIISSIQAL